MGGGGGTAVGRGAVLEGGAWFWPTGGGGGGGAVRLGKCARGRGWRHGLRLGRWAVGRFGWCGVAARLVVMVRGCLLVLLVLWAPLVHINKLRAKRIVLLLLDALDPDWSRAPAAGSFLFLQAGGRDTRACVYACDWRGGRNIARC